MAIIRLKRITTEFDSATHKLLPGEVGVTGKSLIYGSMFETTDGNGKVSGRQVATQNFDNLFTALNTFQSNSKTISLQNAGGTEMYKVSAGRLIASRPPDFSFNENDLVDRKYVDDNIKAADALVLKGTVDASTGVITSSDANVNGKKLIVGANSLNTYLTGWTFKVSAAGTLAGIGAMQVGDMIVAMEDQSATFTTTNWHAFQTNVDFTTTGTNLAKIPDASGTSFIKIYDNTVMRRTAADFKIDLSLNNVTNESKTTMFTNPTFTGNITVGGGIIGNSLDGYTQYFSSSTGGPRISGRYTQEEGYLNLTADTINLSGTVKVNGGEVGTVTSVSGTNNQITVAAGTTTPVLSIPTTFIAPGTIQSTGAMSVGSGSAAWSINGSGTDVMLFAAPGGRSIRLEGGTGTGTKTIAFTDDIPEVSDTADNLSGGVLGSLPYQSAVDTTTLLAPNTTTTVKYLRQVGNGTNGAAPTWGQIAYSEISGRPTIPTSFSISASSNILVATGGANSTSYNVATSRTSGKFYRHATNPTTDTGTEANAVKYEGWLYATRFEGLIDGGTSW